MTTLRPCPFCGGKAESMCGDMVSHRCSKGRGEAFPETWNSRPIEDALIEAAKATLEMMTIPHNHLCEHPTEKIVEGCPRCQAILKTQVQLRAAIASAEPDKAEGREE